MLGRKHAIKTDEMSGNEHPPPRVYLAGPEVFLAFDLARDVADRKKAICRKYGFEGVFPYDVEVKRSEGCHGKQFAMMISEKDECLVRSCEIVVANITPFRSISGDVGTVFEMGYARGLGKVNSAALGRFSPPKTSWCLPIPMTIETTRWSTVSCAEKSDALQARVKDSVSDGLMVEDFGCVDNLMLDGGCASSGGERRVGDTPNFSNDRILHFSKKSRFRRYCGCRICCGGSQHRSHNFRAMRHARQNKNLAPHYRRDTQDENEPHESRDRRGENAFGGSTIFFSS